jgi:hypothetical protein
MESTIKNAAAIEDLLNGLTYAETMKVISYMIMRAFMKTETPEPEKLIRYIRSLSRVQKIIE